MSSHNPYANAYPVGGRPWTPEEDQILLAMTKEGKTYQMVSVVLDRTYAAIKGRIRYVDLNQEERREARRKKQAQRIVPETFRTRHVSAAREVVPPEVFEERNQRVMAPRSLTAILMGDPEPNRVRL